MAKGLRKGNSNSPSLFPLAEVPGGAAQCLAMLQQLSGVRSDIVAFIDSIDERFSGVRSQVNESLDEVAQAIDAMENAAMTALMARLPAVHRKGAK